MGLVWNMFGDIIGTTTGSDYTDYSEAAKNAPANSTQPWTNTPVTTRPKTDKSGLFGPGEAFANALDKGASYDEAVKEATKGGSGLRRTDIDQVLLDTGTTSESQGLRYDPYTGYAYSASPPGVSTNYTMPAPSTQPAYNPVTGLPTQTASAAPGFGVSDLEKLFDKYAPKNPFVRPSDAQLLQWATDYADAQVNPLITAINTNLTRQRAAQESAKNAVEAAYSGLDTKYDERIAESASRATESAIARGMGRSGVADWLAKEYAKPITEAYTQAGAEKAAKLAAIANTIAALETSAADSLTAAEAQRGTLTGSRMGDLQMWADSMAADNWQSSFNNALSMVGMMRDTKNQDLSLILQFLPFLMGGY